MTALRCPVCHGALLRQERVYACPSGHSFDVARQGYVNLLLRAGSGARHGDDRRMVQARRDFLDRGYYDPLARCVAGLACAHTGRSVVLLDAGCGEGKYTCDVLRALREAGKSAEAVGVDISRDALIGAAKRDKGLTLAVASVSDLPMQDGSADLLLNIFSPYAGAEFRRVLKPGGILLRVWPLERHLWELKALIYDAPYPNRPGSPDCEGFTLLETQSLRYPIHLGTPEEIQALFEMTPYYYKTGRADQQKAAQAQSLTVTLEFGVGAYRREQP